jgi:hypothetical protein
MWLIGVLLLLDCRVASEAVVGLGVFGVVVVGSKTRSGVARVSDSGPTSAPAVVRGPGSPSSGTAVNGGDGACSDGGASVG